MTSRGLVGVVLAIVVIGLAGVAHADTAIHEVGIELAPNKANGTSWDTGFGKEPDPAIEVRLDGKVIATCPTKKDTLKANCALADHRFVGPRDIELRVDDADLVNN